MKNLKKIFLLTLFAGLLYSCEDAYEIVQEGEYNEDVAFQTLEDMNLALVELYDNVSTEDAIILSSVLTDEVAIGNDNGGQNIPEYGFQLFSTNDYASNLWLSNYRVINFANRLLAGSEDVILDPEAEFPEDEADEKLRIITEARALRAFSHFQLLTFFSTDLKDDNALGVILLDRVPELSEQLGRSTNGEVFAFINEDLDFVQANLALLASNPRVLVNSAFVIGLRARIAAYRGNYEEALEYANGAISISGGLATSLATYRPIWQDGSLTEVMFGLERPTGKRTIGSEWFFNTTSLGGGPFHDMSRSLYNELVANGGYRVDVFVDPTSLIAQDYQTVFNYRAADVIVIDKYPGVANLPLNNRIKVMRLPEMHFIRAEALAAAGDFAGARAAVQTIRTARGATALPTLTTAQQAWKAILDERRLELCFEGHRYIDLKRLGTLAGVPGVQRYSRDCEPYNACELLVTDDRFTLPIPLDEFNGNTVISAQQNPGY